MKLLVLAQAFTVCQVDSLAGVDLDRPFLFIARTDDELSLVCETEAVPETVKAREDGWRALKVLGPLDFGMVGVIARIAGVLAEKRIALFVVSTFDTDYVLIKADKLAEAIEALKTSGYDMLPA